MKTRFVKEQGVIKWQGQPIELLFNLVANGEYTLEIRNALLTKMPLCGCGLVV